MPDPKIGFNPQDRCMMALRRKLAVVTHGGASTAPKERSPKEGLA